MIQGRYLVLNIDNMAPIFSDYDLADACPLENYFFHRNNLFEKNKQWLRPEENKNEWGHNGQFTINPRFNLIILSNMSDPSMDDEIIQMVRDKIPHQEDFHKVYIKAEE